MGRGRAAQANVGQSERLVLKGLWVSRLQAVVEQFALFPLLEIHWDRYRLGQKRKWNILGVASKAMVLVVWGSESVPRPG